MKNRHDTRGKADRAHAVETRRACIGKRVRSGSDGVHGWGRDRSAVLPRQPVGHKARVQCGRRKTKATKATTRRASPLIPKSAGSPTNGLRRHALERK